VKIRPEQQQNEVRPAPSSSDRRKREKKSASSVSEDRRRRRGQVVNTCKQPRRPAVLTVCRAACDVRRRGKRTQGPWTVDPQQSDECGNLGRAMWLIN